MKTEIVSDTPAALAAAVNLILQDDLVCIPTETVYGLAGNALSEVAVEKIYTVKGRPKNNPLIVHLASIDYIEQVADLKNQSIIIQRLKALNKLWPGPLSVLLPKNERVPDLVTAGSNLVAVRIPQHPLTLALLKMLPCPLAAPSANLYGQVSPTTAQHCLQSLGGKIALILDGGPCQVGIESTVVNLASKQVEILRPGRVTSSELQIALQEDVIIKSKFAAVTSEQLSPGLSKKHYAPKTRLKLLSAYDPKDQHQNVGIIAFSEKSAAVVSSATKVIILSNNCDFDEISARLFAALHEMDTLALDLILIDSCDDIGFGQAIMDRIKRALSED